MQDYESVVGSFIHSFIKHGGHTKRPALCQVLGIEVQEDTIAAPGSSVQWVGRRKTDGELNSYNTIY